MCGLDSNGLRQGPVMVCFEHSTQHSRFIKLGEIR